MAPSLPDPSVSPNLTARLPHGMEWVNPSVTATYTSHAVRPDDWLLRLSRSVAEVLRAGAEGPSSFLGAIAPLGPSAARAGSPVGWGG